MDCILETTDRGYVLNGETVTFEFCSQGTFKDKLFTIFPDGTVREVKKVLATGQTSNFLFEKNAQVLREIQLSDVSHTYAEVFKNLAREGRFSIGSSPEFPGYTYGQLWNGFACPYFSLEIFNDICQHFSVVYASEQETGDDLAECRCFYDPETDAFYCEDYYNDYYRERIGVPSIIHTEKGTLNVYYFEGCWDWQE